MNYLTRGARNRTSKRGRMTQFTRCIAAVAFAATLMLGLGVVTAQPSSAATTGRGHFCEVLTDDSVTQGVMCVDLIEYFTPNPYGQGQWSVYLQVGALCQYDYYLPSSVTTQCSNVHITNWHATMDWIDPFSGQPQHYDAPGIVDGCGHGQQYHPSCVTSGRNYFSDPQVTLMPNQCNLVTGYISVNGATINLPGSNQLGRVLDPSFRVIANLNGSSGGTCLCESGMSLSGSPARATRTRQPLPPLLHGTCPGPTGTVPRAQLTSSSMSTTRTAAWTRTGSRSMNWGTAADRLPPTPTGTPELTTYRSTPPTGHAHRHQPRPDRNPDHHRGRSDGHHYRPGPGSQPEQRHFNAARGGEPGAMSRHEAATP